MPHWGSGARKIVYEAAVCRIKLLFISSSVGISCSEKPGHTSTGSGAKVRWAGAGIAPPVHQMPGGEPPEYPPLSPRAVSVRPVPSRLIVLIVLVALT